MKAGRRVFSILLCVGMLVSGTAVSAHSGESHSHGGHHGNGNDSQSYYYCGGHSAHLHSNGVCPYASSKSSCAGRKSKYCRASTIRRVQKKLNKLGYKCGRADGCRGSATKNAIKKFQRKTGIAVNGKINSSLLKKLHISI